jgi:hypothetical protein
MSFKFISSLRRNKIENENLFINFCINGELNQAKKIFEKNPTLNISAKNEEAFLCLAFLFRFSYFANTKFWRY